MKPEDLIGTWRFSRRIDDRRAAAEDGAAAENGAAAGHRAVAGYRAGGTAEFTRLDDGRIRWFESGELSWDGGASPFTRTLYLVRPDAASRPEPWMVTFDDGRDFHPWTDGDVRHLCGRDTYGGRIDTHEANTNQANIGQPVTQNDPACACRSWSLVWTVSGPAKDYTMTTVYETP